MPTVWFFLHPVFTFDKGTLETTQVVQKQGLPRGSLHFPNTTHLLVRALA